MLLLVVYTASRTTTWLQTLAAMPACAAINKQFGVIFTFITQKSSLGGRARSTRARSESQANQPCCLGGTFPPRSLKAGLGPLCFIVERRKERSEGRKEKFVQRTAFLLLSNKDGAEWKVFTAASDRYLRLQAALSAGLAFDTVKIVTINFNWKREPTAIVPSHLSIYRVLKKLYKFAWKIWATGLYETNIYKFNLTTACLIFTVWHISASEWQHWLWNVKSTQGRRWLAATVRSHKGALLAERRPCSNETRVRRDAAASDVGVGKQKPVLKTS